MTEKNKGLRGKSITLIHNAMHEFVCTHRPGDSGLYQLLDLIVLLIQKPVILVVFTRPLKTILDDPSLGWVLSLPYPTRLRNKLVPEIEKRFRSSRKTHKEWLVEIKGVENRNVKPVDNLTEHVYGFGILYSRLKFEDDPNNLSSGLRLGIDPFYGKLTQTLSEDDMCRVHTLFDSITEHSSSVDKNYKRNFHHISHYWVHARDRERNVVRRSVFQREHAITGDAKDVSPDELHRMLLPVFREIDAMYCDLRGGTPGELAREHYNSHIEAGASMLLSRCRQAISDNERVRPPTIAFYLQLRVPTKDSPDVKNGKGYRIVPIVTSAMAMDLAATLVDHRIREGESAKQEIKDYLSSMGADVQIDDFISVKHIAQIILDAMKIQNFLGDTEYHSMAYPAFSSGLLTILQARACSRIDRHAYGPDEFLEDKDDAAFIKPIFVSGSAYACILTKSHTELLRDSPSDFDSSYDNFMFDNAVLRRWLSRRIRRAVTRAYLDEIRNVVIKTLVTEGGGVTIKLNTNGSQEISIDVTWLQAVNPSLDRLAQAFPYARIGIVGSRDMAKTLTDGPFKKELQSLRALTNSDDDDQHFWFFVANNAYYGRKFIQADERFISQYSLQRTLNSALNAAQIIWDKEGFRYKKQDA